MTQAKFKQSITGAANRAVSTKLSERISAADFGAVGDGVTDDTVALKALFDYCVPNSKVAVLAGTYLVSGVISTNSSRASGSLNIHCDGDVTINMDAAGTAGTAMLMCHTAAITNSTKSGGRLTLNLNNRIANGIYLRHGGGDGGSVDWGPITVTNAKATGAADTAENQALLIYGRFSAVRIDHPIIDGVDRTNTSGGACKGISISEIVGQVTIESPNVARVLCTGSSADADGISIFGLQLNGVYGWRAGTAQVSNAVFTDCQGRSFKAQVSEAVLYRPRIFRKNVVTFNTVDIDFQVGNGLVIEPFFEYRLNGAVSPLHIGFYPVGFGQRCPDRPNRGSVLGGVLRSEVVIPRFIYLTVGADALDGEVLVDGLRMQQLGTFTTSFVNRAFIECQAGQIAASTGKTHVVIKNVRGNISGFPLLGYTDFGASVATKLSFDITGNENTGALATGSKVFANLSGGAIPAVLSFNLRDNAGFVDLFTTWTFNFATVPVGCRFTVDIGSSAATVTNAPGWGASGVALVEGLSMYASTARSVRVTKDHAAAVSTVFFTGNGGTTWGTIK
jgi:hypothetical protein